MNQSEKVVDFISVVFQKISVYDVRFGILKHAYQNRNAAVPVLLTLIILEF